MLLPRFALGTVVTALLTAGPAFARSTDEQQREELRTHAAATLDELFMQVNGSKEHSDNAVGYAVFAVTKAGFFVTGGGGSGVTVE